MPDSRLSLVEPHASQQRIDRVTLVERKTALDALAEFGQRAATRENPFGLTQREQEVLELLCEGRTNAGIATKLVVSPKTVDHHVSSILAKLGVSKRTEVAPRGRPQPPRSRKPYRAKVSRLFALHRTLEGRDQASATVKPAASSMSRADVRKPS